MAYEEQEMADIEISIKDAQEKVEMAAALTRLQKNRDFKKVIMQSYCKDYVLRLVSLKAAPAQSAEETQKYIVGQLDAIGQLQQYFGFIQQNGMLAKDALASAENERELMYAEEEML